MTMNKDYDYSPFSNDPELSALQKVARGLGEDATKMKSEISRQLYIMVSDRLFGGKPWNADKEIAAALIRQARSLAAHSAMRTRSLPSRCRGHRRWLAHGAAPFDSMSAGAPSLACGFATL
jgi:hypothetical protein